MMLPTHAIAGLAIAAPLLVLAPDHTPAALAGGLVGGVLPDLDLYSGHRRTLHYPTGYTLAALPAVIGAAVLQTPLLVAFAFVLLAAALHCRMDRYGGGLELRPWEGTSDRAVFDHHRNAWLPPRRWVRYDGAPEDLAMAAVVAIPLLVVLDGLWPTVVTGLIALSIGYAALRKLLVHVAESLVQWVPLRVLQYVPDRFLEGFDVGTEPATAP
jgi:hypothetical protein